jgi:hypothetical protein
LLKSKWYFFQDILKTLKAFLQHISRLIICWNHAINLATKISSSGFKVSNQTFLFFFFFFFFFRFYSKKK